MVKRSMQHLPSRSTLAHIALFCSTAIAASRTDGVYLALSNKGLASNLSASQFTASVFPGVRWVLFKLQQDYRQVDHARLSCLWEYPLIAHKVVWPHAGSIFPSGVCILFAIPDSTLVNRRGNFLYKPCSLLNSSRYLQLKTRAQFQ